jgi:hypothetical protein
VVWLEEKKFPVVVLALSATFSFTSIPWRGYSIDSWRNEVPHCAPTCSCSMSVSMLHCPFRALLKQVTTTTPHTTGRLLAVSPYIVTFLTFVTIRETSLGYVRLYLDCNMAKARQFQYLMGVWHLR